MKILLLGKNGQVGWALQRSLSPLGACVAVGREEADFTFPERLRQLVQQVRPTVIVNAAAYTAVDQAESESEIAYQVNAEAVGLLAAAAAATGTWLVSYSTDYLFDGTQEAAYRETDLVHPLNVYGASKWQGEQAIRASGCRHLILRTSWVYAPRGQNFAKTILRLAQQRDTLQVISDQVGAPTSAELIADVTALMLYRLQHDNHLAQRASGTYHLTASGRTSWYHYAQFILQQAIASGKQLKVTPEKLLPIATSGYPLPAKRPANSCLNSEKLQRLLSVTLPVWQHHLSQTLESWF